MCGIAGFSLAADEVVDVAQLAYRLLIGIQKRGKDATGIAAFDSATGEIIVRKAPVMASKFAGYKNLGVDYPGTTTPSLGGLEHIPDTCRTVILHTRFATQGAPAYPVNNHPIIVKQKDGTSIVGVHNGMVWNDWDVFKSLDIPREGDVDSEAIFASIAAHPYLHPSIPLNDAEGTMAVAWIRSDSPHVLRMARGDGSPLHVVQTTAGSVVFASERSFIDSALADQLVTQSWGTEVPPRIYIEAKAGVISEWTPWASDVNRILNETLAKVG